MTGNDDWSDSVLRIGTFRLGRLGEGSSKIGELLGFEQAPVTIEARITVGSGSVLIKREIAIAVEREQMGRLNFHAATLVEEMVMETVHELIDVLDKEEDNGRHGS